jgi:hypothetical protein
MKKIPLRLSGEGDEPIGIFFEFDHQSGVASVRKAAFFSRLFLFLLGDSH